MLGRKLNACILTVHFAAFLLKIIKFFTSQYLELGKRLGNNAKPVMVGQLERNQKNSVSSWRMYYQTATIGQRGRKNLAAMQEFGTFFARQKDFAV